jgi:hypothetical protein
VDLPTTHRLKETTTLAGLSKRYYGSTAGWKAIRDDSRNAIPRKWGQSHPLVKLPRYKVGDKVWIPRRPASVRDTAPDSDAFG